MDAKNTLGWLCSVGIAFSCARCGGTVPLFQDAASREAEVFTLDIDGGTSALWDGELPPLDLSEFRLLCGGGALADVDWESAAEDDDFHLTCGGTLSDTDGFWLEVAGQVEYIFGRAGRDVSVRVGQQAADGNNVHVSPVAEPDHPLYLGLGHYDPCNRSHGDSAIMYAQVVIDAELVYSEREWVNVFANTIAHEIGHNLGYNHAGESDVPPDAKYSELMLASHGWHERAQEQRILVAQDTCPPGIAKAPETMP